MNGSFYFSVWAKNAHVIKHHEPPEHEGCESIRVNQLSFGATDYEMPKIIQGCRQICHNWISVAYEGFFQGLMPLCVANGLLVET